MSKHAYLIMAYNNWNQLSKLISVLDDIRNDIFLHIDKKSHFSDDNRHLLMSSSLNSELHLIDSIPVTWGGYSPIDAEMRLLQAATSRGSYEYYHLLSGMDLPIKSQNEIHDFFDDIQGKEVIMFGREPWVTEVETRMKYYWFFQDFAGHSRRVDKLFLKVLDRVCVKIQKVLRVNRISDYKFSAGPNWFSITDQFARYIVNNKLFVKEHFRYGICADESLVQIMAVNSKFGMNVYNPGYSWDHRCIMRLVDWDRGTPYVFRKEDYELIMKSKCMFARKFDEKVDNEIIEMIISRFVSAK